MSLKKKEKPRKDDSEQSAKPKKKAKRYNVVLDVHIHHLALPHCIIKRAYALQRFSHYDC